MKKITATVQCRMTSTRLPGKILLQACGKTMLELMIERLKRIPSLDEIVIATTTNVEDDCLEAIAKKMGTRLFRGSEHDVLDRVVKAAQQAQTDLIVHFTSDCPLIDPFEAEKVIQKYLHGKYDYVSNVLERTYPRGMDTQVFSRALLEEVVRLTQDPAYREHVTLYIYENPQKYVCGNVKAPKEYYAPTTRMTLDYPEDYALIRTVFEQLYPHNKNFLLYDVMRYLNENPDVAALTRHLKQKDARPLEAACH